MATPNARDMDTVAHARFGRPGQEIALQSARTASTQLAHAPEQTIPDPTPRTWSISVIMISLPGGGRFSHVARGSKQLLGG